MEFYKIWRGWGGTIGINKLSLGDLVMNNILVVLVYIVLLALFVSILPTVLIGFYLFWIISSDMEDGNITPNIEQRRVLMIMSIISVIYFMIDFHFGWIAFSILGSATSKESMDGIAIYNLSLGFISLILLFFGHIIYSHNKVRLFRILAILVVTWFSFRFTKPISESIIQNNITQCSADGYINDLRQDELDRIRYENGEYVP